PLSINRRRRRRHRHARRETVRPLERHPRKPRRLFPRRRERFRAQVAARELRTHRGVAAEVTDGSSQLVLSRAAVECPLMTRELAQHILNLHFPAADHARYEELSSKAQQGAISEDE